MRTLAILAALALATSAHAATEYPPGLFEKSPQIDGDTPPPAKRWTHMPDGRWMFVDPGQTQTQGQMCDYEHHCYPDAQAAPPPTQPLDPPLTDAPSLGVPPNADTGMCDEIRHRLFRDLYEVEKAHRICGP